MKEKKTYTLGLDIGTNSIGWAVVDQNHNLATAYGHYMWGVRMFNESNPAKDRRIARNNRRRLARRKERISLLQEIFAQEISQIDPNFYIRLNESFYHLEDKTVQSTLIFDNYLSNREFYHKYPTIWHLRNALIKEENTKFDIRLIYLAIHHIIKYRGNFLNEGDFNINNDSIIVESLNNFVDVCNEVALRYNDNEDAIGDEVYDSYFTSDKVNSDTIPELAKNIVNILLIDDKVVLNNEELDNKNKLDKKKNLSLLFDKNTIFYDCLPSLLVRGKFDIKNIKPIKNGDYDRFEIDFNSEDFDNKLSEAVSTYNEIYDLVASFKDIKNIYDFVFIKRFIGQSGTYISDAFLNKYNDHKKDLKLLKQLYKEYIPSKYNDMFRSVSDKNANNYVHYIGSNSTSSKGKKTYLSHCNQEDFYKSLSTDLEKIKVVAQDKYSYFKDKIDNGTLLLRSNSPRNGSIPNQLHLVELKKILDNQSKFYPFLNEVSDNLTNKEKIIKIFKFKLPYFVGPLKGDKTSNFNWAILKEQKRVYPWNFDEVVDKGETAKLFIERMQNKCTYLKGESDYCLPKASIYFQAYTVLSYINKIKIDGSNIPTDMKQNLFKNLFLNKKNVSKKNILNFIYTNYGVEEERVLLEESNVKFSSFVFFKDNIFKTSEETFKNIELIEDVIKDVTIFNDKEIIKERLVNKYKLKTEQIKKILSLNFKDFGSLSRNLLVGIKISAINMDKESYDGILPLMWESNLNLQEILNSDKFDLKLQIEKYNNENNKSNLNEDNDDFINLYLDEFTNVSPIWTRSFVQAYKIIKDVNEILGFRGEKISYYSLECNRTNKALKGEKGRTKTRFKQIQDLLNAVTINENEQKFYNANVNIKSLNAELNEKKEEVNLRDKLFLYFQQLGKDIYSLEDIDITKLDSEYDIDHIYPQSLIKDDSISNRVITRKEYNNKKSNTFLPDLARRGVVFLNPNRYKFYKLLKDKNFISKSKYERLTEKRIDENILNNFVNRQKTATDQATKAVMNLLRYLLSKEHSNEFNDENALNDYLNKHIIFSKAENVTDFRHEHKIYKSRTANNYHHAHDAYLNAIIGKALRDYYDDKGFYYFKDWKKIADDKESHFTMLPNKILGEYPRFDKNGVVIWSGKPEIKKIYKTIATNFDIRETTYTSKGNTFLKKVTILKKGKGTVSVKDLTPNGNSYLTEKYGAYDSPSYNYYSVVKLIYKNKEEYRLIPINKKLENTHILKEYLFNNYKNLKDFEIILKEVNNSTTLSREKTLYTIAGVTGKYFVLTNSNDRNFTIDKIKTIHDLDKFLNIITYEKKNKASESRSRISFIENGPNSRIETKIFSKSDNKVIEFSVISLTQNDLENLYNYIKELWGKDIFKFSSFYDSFTHILPASLFKDNDLNMQKFLDGVQALNEMLKLLKTNERKTANLEYFGGSSQSGSIKFNGLFEKGYKLIAYSPTGLRHKILFEAD